MKLIRKLKVRRSRGIRPIWSGLLKCPVRVVTVAGNETIKRGCGRRGMVPAEWGWRCFYCGHYVYRAGSGAEALWFHFRLAREYWRVKTHQGREFVNGLPVRGSGDGLPPSWRKDLSEPNPPDWFRHWVSREDPNPSLSLKHSA